jgi:uncharacterized protein (TIGR03083 family)
MERTAFLDALQRDGLAFAGSCAAAGLATPVPSCPAWNVADLVWHLGEVHFFWSSVVGRRMSSPDAYVEPVRPADDALIGFYRSNLDDTVRVLTQVDSDQPVWTWAGQQPAAWVARRMAHETSVHRADADLSAGGAAAVEAQLASDGIDEFLQYFLDGSPDDAAAVGGSVHIHCGDVAGEWTIQPDASGAFAVTREHAKGDCALRGAASDLLLALWRRTPLSSIDVVGDADVAARFVARTRLE